MVDCGSIYSRKGVHNLEKEELYEKWNNVKCPICGNEKMKLTNNTYSLINAKNALRQYAGDKSYEVSPVICEECGYVIFKKSY